MNMASNYTKCSAGATTTIESDRAIGIAGIIASASGSAGTVALLERDGSTNIHTIQVADGTSVVVDFCWYARSGLRVTCSANITATIFHAHGGA